MHKRGSRNGKSITKKETNGSQNDEKVTLQIAGMRRNEQMIQVNMISASGRPFDAWVADDTSFEDMYNMVAESLRDYFHKVEPNLKK